jgi:hypothetical protein
VTEGKAVFHYTRSKETGLMTFDVSSPLLPFRISICALDELASYASDGMSGGHETAGESLDRTIS